MARVCLWRLALLACLTPALPAAAQTPPSTAADAFDVLPEWKVGMRERAEVVRRRSERHDGSEPTRTSSRQVYDISVVEASGGATRLQWMLRHTDEPDTEEATDSLVEAMRGLGQEDVLGRLGRDGFLLNFNADGSYAGLANIDDIARMAAAVMSGLSGQLDGLPDEAHASMTALLTRMQRPEYVEEQVGAPFQLAYQFHGRALTLDRSDAFTDTLDLALIGMRLPAPTAVVSRRLSGDRGEIRFKRILDSRAAGALVTRFIGVMGAPADSLQSMAEDLDMRIVDRLRWLYDTRTGTLLEARSERTTHAGNRRRVDTLVVRRLSAASR